jgi:hypothetical protein
MEDHGDANEAFLAFPSKPFLGSTLVMTVAHFRRYGNSFSLLVSAS